MRLQTTLNWKSNKQLQELIYSKMGIEPIKSRKTGRPTLDENALRKLCVKYPKFEIFKLLEEYRKLNKFYSTYLSIKIDEDKRIRTSYGFTETGRLTSSETPFNTGGNLQNLPKQEGRGKEFRELLTADEGYKLVEVDLNQAEARVVAYESGDENYMSIFETGGDVHAKNAINIFGETDEKLRQLGKKVSHATNYGVGPRTMCEAIIKELGMEYAITERDAKKFQKAYFEAYPRVKTWHTWIKDKLKQDRTLKNYFGRQRYFLAPWGDSLFREAYAFLPQSTVADLLNTGILIWEALPTAPDILLQCHDSVLIQFNNKDDSFIKDIGEYKIRDIKNIFEFPIVINGREIIIPISIKIGDSWGNLKEV